MIGAYSIMPRPKQDALETDRTNQVVNHIRALLEKGELRPGDRIPPERELARTLKISRASLRTRIGYLVAMGVMNVRHGEPSSRMARPNSARRRWA